MSECKIKQGYIISYNGILHKQYQNYPDICVLKNKLYNICINVKLYKNKRDLMTSGPASLAVISFIKNLHKKLRLLVGLGIFSKFQGT